jgi:pimeloyl-ACP methyl ester carboxylesterase
MDLDWIIFPSPESSYTADKNLKGELLFIPKTHHPKTENSTDDNDDINGKIKHIPCLLLRANTNSICPKYVIFFHGNAEDINLAFEMLSHIRFTLSINVIAPEFPGYGIYSGYPKEEQLFQDSLSVYDYMTKELNIPSNNIIIFGRSLGTSVGTFLASQRPATALVLISPLLSIRYVVKDMLGKFVSYAVRDRFKNYEMIEQVQFPILIIHGQNDSLIKYYHATELYNRSKAPCELILPENMDHNEFDFFHEFSEPLLDFISRNAIFAYTETCQPKIPQSIFEVPEEFKEPPKNWNCLNTLLKKFSLS